MNQLEVFRNIKGFIFDIDGVFTNSMVTLTESGELSRQFNVRDHFAIRKALSHDYKVCIITAGNSIGVEKNLNYLGIKNIYTKIRDKKPAFIDFLIQSKLNESEILYMGDDIPDLPILKLVALPTCPADAIPEVKAISKYISPLKGGEGCVRDVIEKVLKLNNQWEH